MRIRSIAARWDIREWVLRGATDMSPRLIILIVLAGGMAVYLATRSAAPDDSSLPTIEGPSLATPKNTLTVWEQDVAGEEPPEVPEFEIRVEVDHTGLKNRLYFYIDEIHGYYVQGLTIDVWYVSTPDQDWEDSPLRLTKIVNDYVRENQSFMGCMDIVPAELSDIGDDIGTEANWVAEVDTWGAARSRDPDPLPVVVRATTCD